MKQMSSFRGRWPGNGLGNNLRLASSANETGDVKNFGACHSWDGDAAGVPIRRRLSRMVA